MKIGIDARLYGPEHTGLGRYVTNLVDHLLKIDKKNFYVLFLNSQHSLDFKPNSKLKIVVTNVPIYGFREQLLLPYIFAREKLDLLHVPHFNAPILYPGKFLITLHDLIKHSSTGSATTTRSFWLYGIKRLGYYFQTFVITRRAQGIIVPSNFVKQNVSHLLHMSTDKFYVTYESSDNNIPKMKLSPKQAEATLHKYQLTQPFLIYTGNVYPHKNIDLLIRAVIQHNQNREVDLCLAISCARSVFYDRINHLISSLHAQDKVKLLGFVDDSDLGKLYSLALALVHPSKMEGFGLTGLEAMNVGLPVISSNTTSLPEVYGDACLYFDPNSLDGLVEVIEEVIKKPEIRLRLSTLGPKQVKKYSWKKMAEDTLSIYQQFAPPK